MFCSDNMHGFKANYYYITHNELAERMKRRESISLPHPTAPFPTHLKTKNKRKQHYFMTLSWVSSFQTALFFAEHTGPVNWTVYFS